MSFAEVILRVGVTLVSWMMIYMHLVMMLILRVAQCPGGDTSPWKVTLITGVLAAGSSFAALYGHGARGMGEVFRYFALPLLVLVPWAAWLTLPYLTGATFGTLGMCDVRLGEVSGSAVAGWQRGWAPLQLVVFAALAANGVRAWRQQDRAHE